MNEQLTPTLERVRRRGITYLFVNYRGLDEETIVEALSANTRCIQTLAKAGEGPFFRLIDLHDTSATNKLMGLFKEHSKILKPHDKAVALLGISPGRQVLLDIVNRFVGTTKRAFKTREEAEDWLASHVE